MCLSSTALLGAAQEPLSWQHLTTKGRKLLSTPEFEKLFNLFESANGKITFATMHTYVGGLTSPLIKHKTENVDAFSSIFPLPNEYKVRIMSIMYVSSYIQFCKVTQAVFPQVPVSHTKGSRNFACPFCCQVKIGTNPKEHLVTRPCSKDSIIISQERRAWVAQEICKNRIVMLASQMNKISKIVSPKEQVIVKIVFLVLGGLLLDERFKIININELILFVCFLKFC